MKIKKENKKASYTRQYARERLNKKDPLYTAGHIRHKIKIVFMRGIHKQFLHKKSCDIATAW